MELGFEGLTPIYSLTISHHIPTASRQIQPTVEVMMAAKKAIFKMDSRMLFRLYAAHLLRCESDNPST